jgi:hypothetical protein
MGLCHVHKQMSLERFLSRSLFVWLALSPGGCVFIRSVDLQQSPERPGHAGGYRIILSLPKCSRILHQLQIYTQEAQNTLPRLRDVLWPLCLKP